MANGDGGLSYQFADGQTFPSLSAAGCAVTGRVSCDGRTFWRILGEDGQLNAIERTAPRSRTPKDQNGVDGQNQGSKNGTKPKSASDPAKPKAAKPERKAKEDTRPLAYRVVTLGVDGNWSVGNVAYGTSEEAKEAVKRAFTKAKGKGTRYSVKAVDGKDAIEKAKALHAKKPSNGAVDKPVLEPEPAAT